MFESKKKFLNNENIVQIIKFEKYKTQVNKLIFIFVNNIMVRGDSNFFGTDR